MSAESGPPRPLAASAPDQPPALADRLAAQLNTLSEVVESLTYRLLELEENLAAQQTVLESVGSGAPHGLAAGLEATEGRLDGTEQRLGRIEALLQEVVPPAQAAREFPGPASAEPPIDAPFADEQEQLFMDEWPEAMSA